MTITPYDEDELEFYGLVNDIVRFRERYGVRKLARVLVESMPIDTESLVREITIAKGNIDGIHD
jgi:hypothetical protein